MSKIKYSSNLLKDFNKLLVDFRYFLSLNLMHADKDLAPVCSKKMLELIKYSLESNKKLQILFKEPILKHEEYNRTVLEKNISNVLKFMHEYLDYSGEILHKCKKDIYDERYKQIFVHYKKFIKKYL